MPQPTATSSPPSPQWLGLALLAAGTLGVALRVAMGFESFWLDEAWSWGIARQAESAAALFTEFKHDNNHPLNTLYLYAVRDAAASAHWIFLRTPSLIAGCLSLVVLARLGAAWGRGAMLVVVLLAATSFPLVAASAQARGYAVAILASLVYVEITRRADERASGVAALALVGAAGLGLLSHPTFFYPLAGAVVLTAARSLERGEGVVAAAARTASLHAVPVALAAVLFLGFYLQADVGGGSLYDRWETVRQAAAQTMALPRRGPLTWVASLVALVLSAQGLRVLWLRGERAMASFFIVTLVLAPTFVIVISNPTLIYARYLLTTFAWFYLLAAVGLAALWGKGRVGRALVVAVVGLFVASNGLHSMRVLAEGRNDYLDTLRFIDERTSADTIEIGSDHDFRNATVLRFYQGRLPSRRPVVYVPSSRWSRSVPEWYLRHDWKAGSNPEPVYEPVPGLRYELQTTFEHGPGDGFQWFVYRRAGRAPQRPRG